MCKQEFDDFSYTRGKEEKYCDTCKKEIAEQEELQMSEKPNWKI